VKYIEAYMKNSSLRFNIAYMITRIISHKLVKISVVEFHQVGGRTGEEKRDIPYITLCKQVSLVISLHQNWKSPSLSFKNISEMVCGLRL
jgi:hypothetical protein